jgi:hypothetical protein
MLRGSSHPNKMQLEPKSRELKQAVNKRHPFSDEKRTVGPISPEKHIDSANRFHVDISQLPQE